jgi:hypothetical protein
MILFLEHKINRNEQECKAYDVIKSQRFLKYRRSKDAKYYESDYFLNHL